MKRVFITGIAGFIGCHLGLQLQKRGDAVFGCDNFNAYYDPELKKDRVRLLSGKGIQVVHCDIVDRAALEREFEKHGITHCVHLAAQAGVRHSLKAPEDYVHSNLTGFVQLLEALRRFPSIKLTYASSSSVYGLNSKIPFSESDPVDRPTSLYGATKKKQRAHRPLLSPHPRPLDHGTSLFYRLWAVGTPRHGLLFLLQSHPQR